MERGGVEKRDKGGRGFTSMKAAAGLAKSEVSAEKT